MKLWIFNHYASTPDQPMTGAYFLSKALAGNGHNITTFASSFSYYKRKEIRLKGLQFTKTEVWDGIKYIWVRTLPNGNDFVTRSINIVSYFFMSMLTALITREKPDIIMGTCPHLLGVLAAFIISRIKGCKFVFEVRDLWPQSFIDNKKVKKDSIFISFLRKLEKFLYIKADRIITVHPFVYEYIESLGIKKEKVVWVPNGIDTSFFTEINDYDGTPNDNLILMYLGGHANYQGIDTILDAAKIIQDENIKKIRFVFIGDGVEKPSLIKYAKKLELNNVEFRDPVPRAKLCLSMNEASVFIFHLKRLDAIEKYGMSPNKLCDYLIAGRPVLSAVSVKNDTVTDANAGISIPPEDSIQMAQAIKSFLVMSPEDRKIMGDNGRKHVLKNFDIKILADKFEKEMLSLTQ